LGFTPPFGGRGGCRKNVTLFILRSLFFDVLMVSFAYYLVSVFLVVNLHCDEV
jgi:hypothetical protein